MTYIIVNELHEPHELLVSFVSFDDFLLSTIICVICVIWTFIIQFHVRFYLRVLRVLRWQPHHHVRCFTHLFCTFIGGKFEGSDCMEKSVSNR